MSSAENLWAGPRLLNELVELVELVERVELVRKGSHEEPFGTSSREAFGVVRRIRHGSLSVVEPLPADL
jgi:hypothetical protein